MPTMDELHNNLMAAIPTTGKISYEALEAALSAQGKRDALKTFRNAKARGLIRAEIISNPDGTISHNVWLNTP